MPQNDIEYVTGLLEPLAHALVVVQGARHLLPVEDAAVHGLVDALARGGHRGGSDGRGPLDGLGVNSHGSVLAADSEVAGCDLGWRSRLGLVLGGLLCCLEGIKFIARLDDSVGGVIAVRGQVFPVWKCEVGVEQDSEEDQGKQGESSQEIGGD